MDYCIRKRERKDCFDVANVIALAWNETYKGIVPDEELKRLLNVKEEMGQRSYDKFDKDNNNKLVLEVNGKIVGFVGYGEADDPDYLGIGEIQALYILNEAHGLGLGRKLVDEAIKELKKLGYSSMIISCFKGNPSNDFYKHIGGKYVKDRIYERLNLPENVYYFEKI